MKISIHVNLKVNRVIRYCIISDLMLLAGWGLIEPILSVYALNSIPGATLVTVGTAAAIYWIVKSLLQLPIANYLDKNPGEQDDFRALIGGLLVASFGAFSFSFVRAPWQLYLAQVIHAIGFALYVPSWAAIFSRHLDKERISFDWSLDSTTAGLAAGVSGFLGSVVANTFGFRTAFFLAALLTATSAFVLLFIPELLFPKKNVKPSALQDHTPTNIGQ